MVKAPAKSTVHAVLDCNGLVKRRKRRRYREEGTLFSDARSPNGRFSMPQCLIYHSFSALGFYL